jgi:hypothetical protein
MTWLYTACIAVFTVYIVRLYRHTWPCEDTLASPLFLQLMFRVLPRAELTSSTLPCPRQAKQTASNHRRRETRHGKGVGPLVGGVRNYLARHLRRRNPPLRHVLISRVSCLLRQFRNLDRCCCTQTLSQHVCDVLQAQSRSPRYSVNDVCTRTALKLDLQPMRTPEQCGTHARFHIIAHTPDNFSVF